MLGLFTSLWTREWGKKQDRDLHGADLLRATPIGLMPSACPPESLRPSKISHYLENRCSDYEGDTSDSYQLLERTG